MFAEFMEERTLAKENFREANTNETQSSILVSKGLARVHEVAKKERGQSYDLMFLTIL
jgi:hypothetical protein